MFFLFFNSTKKKSKSFFQQEVFDQFPLCCLPVSQHLQSPHVSGGIQMERRSNSSSLAAQLPSPKPTLRQAVSC